MVHKQAAAMALVGADMDAALGAAEEGHKADTDHTDSSR